VSVYHSMSATEKKPGFDPGLYLCEVFILLKYNRINIVTWRLEVHRFFPLESDYSSGVFILWYELVDRKFPQFHDK